MFRTSATVKGGRRFSFGALVVVGDKRGRVGFGYGKSNEVPQAVDKAQKYAKRSMLEIPMAGRTLPH
ncbi:MAG: 30S ribosomal protein S5, partial [Phycisphaerae bacterium]